ncbi:MAG: hypothetical protein A2Y12_11555 [Planctomycetes bacterium GWF2_42_9]|nr:MAG: hypothetical protein A2Y12_11555 [Planctomycetes bacterium GWF2_42_9]
MRKIDFKKYCAGRGFTLVELLVVISIIALLLSILMPSLQKARESGKTIVCRSNLKQVFMAAILYGEDNDGIIPPHFFASGGEADDHHIWSSMIASYLGSQKATKGAKSGWWTSEGESALKLLKCPSQRDKFYPLNYYIRYGINSSNCSSYDGTYTILTKLKWAKISRPGIRLYIADSMDAGSSYIKIDSSIARFRAIGVFGYMGHYILPYEDRRAGSIWLVSDRHNRSSNSLFLDGHSEPKKYEELMFKKSDTDSERKQKEKMWDSRN